MDAGECLGMLGRGKGGGSGIGNNSLRLIPAPLLILN